MKIGKADGLFATNLIERINKKVKGGRVDIGSLDLLSVYSLFDVRKNDARKVIAGLKKAEFYGKRIYVEEASENKDYASENRGKGKRSSRGEDMRKRASDGPRRGRRDGASHSKSRERRDSRPSDKKNKK